MIANAIAAIPEPGEYVLSLNQIFNRQEKPRLPRKELQDLLDTLILRGEVERVRSGHMHYYRKKAPVRGLALLGVSAHNNGKRNEFSLDATVDWFLQALYPLRLGNPVILWVEDPRIKKRKNYRGAVKRLMILIPGIMLGQSSDFVLVSIVGSGSCIVGVHDTKVANLVLAGMPAPLADGLMKALHRVFAP